jgi:acyl-CoA thioester hydrolase
MSDGWCEILRGVVHPWHHDQFGHMNVRWYAHFFDDAAFHLYPEFGISLTQMQKEHGVHTVTASATTNFVKELNAGDLIRIEGGVGRIGGKSVTFALRMLSVDSAELHATYDLVEVFFDPETRKSAEIPHAVRELLAAHVVEHD